MHLKKVLFFFLVFILPFSGYASHLYGADFFYEHISGNTYKLTLVAYGDCSGSSYSSLSLSSPQVILYNDSVNFGSQVFSLSLTGPGVEVTPVCPAQINNTNCNGGSIPGVGRYIYSATITIPFASTGWRFRFTGNMGGSFSAGRSAAITNLAVTQTLLNLDAQLNNAAGPNSSPQFTTIPTPFYCINVAQQYNQGAVDANGDSLYYSLAPAIDASGPVAYVSGYSPTSPLATSGNFTFSNTTGQMAFTPSSAQRSVVVNKVTEYRNGVMVGSATREMTFIVATTCSGSPPGGGIDTAFGTISGGLAVGPNEIAVCYGAGSLVQFSIHPTDPEGDSINLSANGLPSGATLNVTNNNTATPTATFNWNTTGVAAGSYTFYITYKDFGCPLSHQQTFAYTVRIVKPNELSTTVTAPTQCTHKAKLRYNLSFGMLPRTIVVSQGSNIIKTFTDSTGTVVDSLSPGVYTFNISSPHLTCGSQYTVTVVDSGTYPFKPAFTSPIGYCLGDPSVALSATPAAGATIRWYDVAGNYLPTAPTPPTSSAGLTNYLVSQKFNVCESLKDTVKVYVTQRPVASILAPSTICTKDTAVIAFNGATGVGPIINYQWTWDGADYLAGSGAGPYRAKWNNPGVKTLTLQVFENLCPSTKVSQQVTVRPTPKAIFSLPTDACLDDTVNLQYNTAPLSGQQYTWVFDGASVLQGSGAGPYKLHWGSSGIKHVTLEVSLAGCSDTASRNINIHPSPQAHILNIPGKVCLGDKIYLIAKGGISYSWSPVERLLYEADGTLYTRVVEPTTYIVSVKNEFGCVATDSIRYANLEPCCTFSYPDAFSPNNDGRNDTYHIITYGNQLAFEFSIYNRWGERMFYTFDPHAAWDGNYNNKPCATGTYFYVLKSRCYTGHDEVHKGDFQLLR